MTVVLRPDNAHKAATRSNPRAGWLPITIMSAMLAVTVLLAAPKAYPAVVVAAMTIAATLVAICDQRTRRIPNAAVINIATFALIQILAAAIIAGPMVMIPAAGAAGVMLVITTAAAIAGWSGLGDAKLLTALTLCLTVIIGWYALYLLPLALTIETARRLLTRRCGRQPFAPSIALATLTLGAISILLQ